ncbi:MAG: hypothetical protein AAFQ65_09535 [Myxococcota bacterium]
MRPRPTLLLLVAALLAHACGEDTPTSDPIDLFDAPDSPGGDSGPGDDADDNANDERDEENDDRDEEPTPETGPCGGCVEACLDAGYGGFNTSAGCNEGTCYCSPSSCSVDNGAALCEREGYAAYAGRCEKQETTTMYTCVNSGTCSSTELTRCSSSGRTPICLNNGATLCLEQSSSDDDEEEEPEPEPEPEDDDSCSSDYQCGHREACKYGRCQSVQCTSDAHCGGCTRCDTDLNYCIACGYGPYGCYC